MGRFPWASPLVRRLALACTFFILIFATGCSSPLLPASPGQTQVLPQEFPNSTDSAGTTAVMPVGQKPSLPQEAAKIIPPLPPSPIQENSSIAKAIEALAPNLPKVHFYYSPLCPYSVRAALLVEQLEKEYVGKVEFIRHDVLTNGGYADFDQMIASRGLSNASRVVPIITGGGKMLTGIDEINSGLPDIVSSLAQ